MPCQCISRLCSFANKDTDCTHLFELCHSFFFISQPIDTMKTALSGNLIQKPKLICCKNIKHLEHYTQKTHIQVYVRQKQLIHLHQKTLITQHAKLLTKCPPVNNNITTRMWANAQRDGRPAKYRWRPLFIAAKFG